MSDDLRILPDAYAPDPEADRRREEYVADRERWTGRSSAGWTRLRDIDPLSKPQRRARRDKEAYAALLREHQTDSERAFGVQLARFESLEVRPQEVVAGWIVDFLVPDLRLIIEVDGSIHRSWRIEQDGIRQQRLEDAGYHVIRVTNAEVANGIGFRRVFAWLEWQALEGGQEDAGA